jgi:hypothetical protein
MAYSYVKAVRSLFRFSARGNAHEPVMAGLVPAIHVFFAAKTWMPGIADKV